MKLAWKRALGAPTGYDVFRAEAGGETRIVEAVKGAKFADRLALGGLAYTYYVRAYDAAGRPSAPSETIRVELPIPAYGEVQHA